MTDLQPAFRALADPTRREILMMLGDDDLTVAEVAGHFDMTRAAVKKHLTVLEDGALIRSEARGRERVHYLKPEAIRPVFDWLRFFDRFWDTKLEDLKHAVENTGKTND